MFLTVLFSQLQRFTSRILRIKSSFALQETPVVEAEAVVEIQVNIYILRAVEPFGPVKKC